MKTLGIKEFGDFMLPDSECFDLTKTELKHCVGCWSCWWRTPGICVFNDLEDFYRDYVNADQVVIFAKLEHGFISSKLKTLLDRTIPLVLPYTVYTKGETWHLPRYPKYPGVTFYYDYDFQEKEETDILHDYIKRVFEQFYSKEIRIRSISSFEGAL